MSHAFSIAQNGAASIVSAISMAVTGRKSEEEDEEYEKSLGEAVVPSVCSSKRYILNHLNML